MQKDLRIPLSKYKIIIALQIQNHFFQIFKYPFNFNFNVGPRFKATTKYTLGISLKFESYLLYTGRVPITWEFSDEFDIVFLNNSLI